MLRQLSSILNHRTSLFTVGRAKNLSFLAPHSRSFYSSHKKSSSCSESNLGQQSENNDASKSNTEQTSTERSSTAPADNAKAVDSKPLHEIETKMRTLQDAYLQQLADMENLRSRTRKEVENASQFSIHSFSKDLLSVVDVLEIALKASPQSLPQSDSSKTEATYETLHEGVKMTHSELVNVLKRHGVEQFNPLHERFDPNMHNALYQISTQEHEPGIVVAVEKFGYLLKGRLLRPAAVGVSTK